MGSFVMQDFLGSGVLKDLTSKLAEDGWDDVPTLKVIGAEDMEALELTDAQRDALELRIYLHDRSLMEYADKLEASGISLIDLISTSPSLLVSQYGMRRVHVARFIDRSMACGIQMPPNLTPQPTKRRSMEGARGTTISTTKSEAGEVPTSPSPSPPPADVAMAMKEFPSTETKSITETPLPESKSPSSPLPESKSPGSPSSETKSTRSVPNTPPSVDGQSETGSGLSQLGFENPSAIRPIGAKKPNAPKGVFSAPPAPARMCGLVPAQQVGNNVTQLPVMERVYVRKLAPEHKQGCDPWTMKEMKMPPPFKASELWADKATLLFCLRRPGCVMCRAEAHQLYARKPIFDAMGIQLVAVLNEHIDSEVKSFWPRYWGGMVVVDEKRDLFKALGGGKLLKENVITGFIFNPIARLNWNRARATGIEYTKAGEGTIKGGLYVVRRGKGGVAYQFVERNFGDWAPLDEIMQVGEDIRIEQEAEDGVDQ